MDFSRTLFALGNASSEYEVCEAIASLITENKLVDAFAIYLNDSDERSHCIIELYPLSELQGTNILNIHYFDRQLGSIHYQSKSSDNQADLLHIAQLAGIALTALKHNQEVEKQTRRLGKTSLILDTMLEMLSDIILQKDRFAIARIAGQFLMGQLRIGTYALIGKSDQHIYEPLSFNGFTKEEVIAFTSMIVHDKNKAAMDLRLIPMKHGNVEQGFIIFESEGQYHLSESDAAFVSMVGMITALSLERTALFEEEARLAALHKDLVLAAEIQKQLLPDFTEHLRGCEISGKNIPSGKIGGDYVDILQYPDGSLLLIMGDVSGKGVSAAMIMTMVKSACTLLVKQQLKPEAIVQSINELVQEQTSADTFMTFACIHINADRTFLTSINAGHEFPLLKKQSGIIIELDKGCMVLGVVHTIEHMKLSEYPLDKGDIICMYTDGVCDSSLENGNVLIKKELTSCNKVSVHSAEDIINSIMNQNQETQGARINDDASLLLLRIS